jgi:hypothetical protein
VAKEVPEWMEESNFERITSVFVFQDIQDNSETYEGQND